MRILSAAALALLASCAGPKEAAPPPVPMPGAVAAPAAAAAAPAAPVYDVKAMIANAYTPGECAKRASELRRANPDKGWEMLRGCVERGRFPRADFTDLRVLTGGEWDQDLSTRPDAVHLVAKLVALRGGDVEGDLQKLHAHRAPVFELHAALSQPEIYKGRWLLLRGKIGDLRVEQQKPVAMLRQTAMEGKTTEVQVGTKYKSSSSGSVRASGSYDTSNYGSGKGSYAADSRRSSEWVATKEQYDNASVETGRRVLAKLAKPDPFLQPDQEFVFLVRFDGTRAMPDEEKPVGLVTVVAYHAPGPMLVD